MNEMRPPRATARRDDISAIVRRYDRVALVLQGGGALGAYQVGVYQALADAGCEPNWISGVSIGAINSAIIAGNGPERRLQNLKTFWNTVSGRKIWAFTPEGDIFRDMRNQTSSLVTLLFGQPGFFQPRNPNPWLHLPGAHGATSYYESSALKNTLENLIDFDFLNDGRKRLSVGAVNVRTGNFIYFDTQKHRIGPEHIMASAALPPAFPAVKIEGEYYWDGGIVSNTPLQYLLEQDEHQSSLVFQVDLFSARRPPSRDVGRPHPPQGDYVFKPHPPEYGCFRPRPQFEDASGRSSEKGPSRSPAAWGKGVHCRMLRCRCHQHRASHLSA
jgi:NTE family protein